MAACLYGLALWLRLQLLHTPPYGDEGLHYWIARHFTAMPDNVSDVDGLTWFHPFWIFWQRPAYYVLLHPFALGGFEGFRVGHALWSSLLPVVAFGLVRAHGATRVAAFAAGLVAAAFPPFVTWGGLGLMDEPMTAAFGAALWAMRLGRHVLAAGLFVLSVWTKESAFIGLAGVAAASLFVGWVQGRNRFEPFELDRRTACLLGASALALLPLQLSLVQGLDNIGGASSGHAGPLVDATWATPWLLPVLVGGLWFRASRPLCALAVGLGLAYLALHAAGHRTVELWYLVQPAFLAVCAAAVALDAAVRRSFALGRRQAAAAGAVAVVVLLLAAAILLPASAAKSSVLSPVTRQSSPSLAEGLQFERQGRDRDLVAALDALDLDPSRDVVAVDVLYAYDLYPLSERARHVTVDSAALRAAAPSLGAARFAAIAETNGTMLLVGKTEFPFTAALDKAYGPCRVLDAGTFRVYEAWRCQGGKAVLAR